jgi:hypothetical protein
MNNILNLSVAQLKRAITIKEQIESLESELASVLGTTPAPAPAPAVASAVAPAPAKKKKVMSPAARAKIGAAQKARWAKLKETSTPAAKAPAAAPKKKKRKLSPEGRAKIVAAAKARWAAHKKRAK